MGIKGRLLPQVVAGLVIILIGVAGTVALVRSKPKVKKVRSEVKPPLVTVIKVDPSSIPVWVRGEGTVRPLHEAEISSQVSGRVVEVSPFFVKGGRVKKGEVLLSVERKDYEVAVALAEAKLRQAEARLQELLEESRISREEWERYFSPDENPPSLLVKEPQIKAARAELDAARAQLEKAKLDLDRTRVRAPFDGVVVEKKADLGDFLTPGKTVGRVYAASAAEIEVYLSESEIDLISVPGFNTRERSGSQARVILSAGEREVVWGGTVVRTSGQVDEKTRMIPIVVRVSDPFSKTPPLMSGAFVRVEILGKKLDKGVVLPDYAIRWGEGGETLLWVVDGNNRLRFRKVEVALFDEGKVFIERGLEAGDLVITTPLRAVTDGMPVRVKLEDAR